MRIKQMMVLAVIFANALVYFGVRAQTKAPPSRDYQAIADRFFVLLKQGKPDEALDYFFSTNVALKNIPTAGQLRGQLEELKKKGGSCLSQTKLAETKIAGTFVYQHYFVAYEAQPISFRLKFYKPRDTWQAFGIEFDDELPGLIQKQTDQNLYREFK